VTRRERRPVSMAAAFAADAAGAAVICLRRRPSASDWRIIRDNLDAARTQRVAGGRGLTERLR